MNPLQKCVEPTPLFVADDLNNWIGPGKGHPQTITPDLDRLARRGVTFQNAQVYGKYYNPMGQPLYGPTSLRPFMSVRLALISSENPLRWHPMKPLRLAILRSVTLAFLGCPAFLSSGQTVSNVTATASSGLYWVMNGTNVIVDRRPQYACDGSGLFGGSSGDEEHVSHEGTAWESVGNGWTEQVGIPGGDDPAPWIKFTFTQAYSISSFSAWNFGEPPHAIYRTAVFADDTNFLGTFTFDTNSSSAQDTLKQTFQLPTPVTAASMTFVVQQNGGGITFPTITNGLATLVGIGEMRFYCTPVLLLSPVPSGSGVGITWISQTNYSYQLESTADLRPPAAWTNDGAPLLGNGDILSVFRPSDSGNKFFRVRVSP